MNDFRLRSCLIGFYNVKDLGGLVKCESGNERSVNVINIKVLLLNVWIWWGEDKFIFFCVDW